MAAVKLKKLAQDAQRCDHLGRAYAGSQRQIQHYVNDAAALLDLAIGEAVGQQLQLRWVSPLAADEYREYKDGAFLKLVGMGKYVQDLAEFWPTGGPRWDALASVGLGSTGVLLLEAKSHVPELFGTCKAKSEQSLRRIDLAMAATKSWLNVDAEASFDWRRGPLYQMANRLAHLYLFRQVLGIDAWLVNVYFEGDPHSPTSLRDWKVALVQAKRSLGVKEIPYAVDVFLPAS